MAQELIVRGRRVELARGGDGPALLFLHDPIAHGWMPVHDRLGAEHTVYVPAHPGCGATEGAEDIECMDDLVLHTIDVMDTLGLECVDVVGVSLGGWLAAELAVRYAARVQRLVLVDAEGLDVPGVRRRDVLAVPAPQARPMLFADPTSEAATALLPDTAGAWPCRDVVARLLGNAPADFRRLAMRLWRIATPTLVLWGAEDRVVPVAHGLAWQHGIPGARLITLERCGHLPPYEQPDEFARLVLEFLMDF